MIASQSADMRLWSGGRIEPAAYSSRTGSIAGRLSVVPASSMCQRSHSLVAVRGHCCTSALYLMRLTLLAKIVHAAAWHAPLLVVVADPAGHQSLSTLRSCSGIRMSFTSPVLLLR